ncbi:unnamed protein product [Mytilus coruscus]|uniref:PiggyBac transposable element-derived protein 4 C-terminal zinc-finger domain-containing protein n=1 Tax=Mytilus coruscus TaxID=42192 RepID=A0A6J8DM63_MYTCO|nr:unnamed protein product [Mytilus coruscus]
MLERGIIDPDVLHFQTNLVDRHRDEMTMFMQEQEKPHFPSPQKFQPPPASNPSTGLEHRLVHNEGYKYKLCVQCQFNKIKTKKGWRVYTHFKCEKCNVPLCKNQGSQKRNCFVVYHQTELGDSKSVNVNTLPLVAPSEPSNSWSFTNSRSPEAHHIEAVDSIRQTSGVTNVSPSTKSSDRRHSLPVMTSDLSFERGTRGRPSRMSEIELVDFIDPNVHTVVRTVENKYKPCVFCQIQKRKTKKGWYIYSYYKCKACDIPLCTGQRNCFNDYHAYISGNYVPSESEQDERQMIH